MITSHSVRRVALIAALVAVPGLQAAEVAGVKVEEKLKVGGSELVLNGAGLRSKLFIKVYVGALYVGQKSTTPAGIYDSTVPRRMVMRMLREMGAETRHGAVDDGLHRNLAPPDPSHLNAQAQQLPTLMK